MVGAVLAPIGLPQRKAGDQELSAPAFSAIFGQTEGQSMAAGDFLSRMELISPADIAPMAAIRK